MAFDLARYLELVEEPRRSYARAYADWLAANDGSAPPQKPEAMARQVAINMRRRIDQLSKGREFRPLETNE